MTGPPLAPACLACDGRLPQRVRRYRTHTPEGRAIFGGAWLHACAGCGLVQAVPRPSAAALDAYYAESYRRRGYAGSDVADPARFPRDNLFYYNRAHSITALLAPHVRSATPRILDVGAGYGHTLHALGERYPGATRLAIELTDVCVRHLGTLGVEVLARPAEEVLPQLPLPVDVAVLSHVLEHLQAPGAVLASLHARLGDAGVLYVEVPHVPPESRARRPDHVWAPRFDEPHVMFFSPETLLALLDRTGFDVRFCDTAGPRYRYVSPLRYRLPQARWRAQQLIPTPLFRWLRQRPWTRPLRVQPREDAFYQYGGDRLWIRCVAARRR